MALNTDDAAAEHQRALMAAFVSLLKAEGEERRAEAAVEAVRLEQEPALRQSRQAQADAWEDIAALMAETGEVEVVLPDETHDYKVAWAAPPEVIDVPDPAAAPDEFCQVERSVRRKDALAHLKGLRDAGLPLPNWGSIKRNPARLAYRVVKKGAP